MLVQQSPSKITITTAAAAASLGKLAHQIHHLRRQNLSPITTPALAQVIQTPDRVLDSVPHGARQAPNQRRNAAAIDDDPGVIGGDGGVADAAGAELDEAFVGLGEAVDEELEDVELSDEGVVVGIVGEVG